MNLVLDVTAALMVDSGWRQGRAWGVGARGGPQDSLGANIGSRPPARLGGRPRHDSSPYVGGKGGETVSGSDPAGSKEKGQERCCQEKEERETQLVDSDTRAGRSRWWPVSALVRPPPRPPLGQLPAPRQSQQRAADPACVARSSANNHQSFLCKMQDKETDLRKPNA